MVYNMAISLLLNLMHGQSLREIIAKNYSVKISMQKVQRYGITELYRLLICPHFIFLALILLCFQDSGMGFVCLFLFCWGFLTKSLCI